jgi:hypothetical protein
MCVVGSVSVVGLVSCGIVTCVALRALVDLFVLALCVVCASVSFETLGALSAGARRLGVSLI